MLLYSCNFQEIPNMIISKVIMLHLWVNAETKKIVTGLPDFFLCYFDLYYLLYISDFFAKTAVLAEFP